MVDGRCYTDFYSQHHEIHESGIIYKGLKEPDAKRTVEGDLGMRVSAELCFCCRQNFLQQNYSAEELVCLIHILQKLPKQLIIFQ